MYTVIATCILKNKLSRDVPFGNNTACCVTRTIKQKGTHTYIIYNSGVIDLNRRLPMCVCVLGVSGQGVQMKPIPVSV